MSVLDSPGFSLVTLYLLTVHTNDHSSYASTHWKLINDSRLVPVCSKSAHHSTAANGISASPHHRSKRISTTSSHEPHNASFLADSVATLSTDEEARILWILNSLERDPSQPHHWILTWESHMRALHAVQVLKDAMEEEEEVEETSNAGPSPSPHANKSSRSVSPSTPSSSSSSSSTATRPNTTTSVKASIITVPESGKKVRTTTSVSGRAAASAPRIVSSKDTGGSSSLSSPARSTPPSYSPPQSPAVNGGAGPQCVHMSQVKTVASTMNCLPAVNSTPYDHLKGVAQRATLAEVQESDAVSLLAHHFSSVIHPGDPYRVDLDKLERMLLRDRTKRPNSPEVHSHIGNLLRLYGDSKGAVECFRHALHLAPFHAAALHSLAKLLFRHRFSDEALYLARISLQSEKVASLMWSHHFALVEILAGIGRMEEAAYHLQMTLKLNPDYAPAKMLLEHSRDLSWWSWLRELLSNNPLLTLALSVLSFSLLLSLMDRVFDISGILGLSSESMKPHRHFNRGMAMRMLRQTGVNMTPRTVKCRRSAA